MSHLITGIPPGSQITVLAMKRFPQDKFHSRTGAIRIWATRVAYPIMLLVRPSTHVTSATVSGRPMGFKNYGPVNLPVAGSSSRAGGPSIDFEILNADEFREPESNPYLTTRHSAQAEIRTTEVQAANSPTTDIYQRLFCAGGCGAIVSETGQTCATCQVPAPKNCEAPKVGAGGLTECPSPRYRNLNVCRAHGEEMGLVSVENQCQWRGCAADATVGPFCIEHLKAMRAILMADAPAPQPAPAMPPMQPVVYATPVPPSAKPRGAASHKPGCVCVSCKARRRKAAAAESHAREVEPDVVMSGVDAASEG